MIRWQFSGEFLERFAGRRYFKPLQLQPFVQQEWLQAAFFTTSTWPEVFSTGPRVEATGMVTWTPPQMKLEEAGFGIATRWKHMMLKHDENWRVWGVITGAPNNAEHMLQIVTAFAHLA